MTIRAVSLLLLFVAAFVFSATLSAFGVSAAAFLGWPANMWFVPAVLFICNVALFFVGRGYILPEHLASPPSRALLLIAAWIGVTMVVTAAAVWALRETPAAAFVSGGRIMLAWFFLLLASGSLLANHGRGPYGERRSSS
jgi:hypothetical protein